MPLCCSEPVTPDLKLDGDQRPHSAENGYWSLEYQIQIHRLNVFQLEHVMQQKALRASLTPY